MNEKYYVGQIAYLVENNCGVIEGRITGIRGDIVTLHSISGRSASNVSLCSLYPTEEAALASRTR